ncbi:uncharacterized protein FFC1_15703 [Fusarium fujikuroi]|nr:uncharacterized protein FFC1_15703 [Fusarium fujikuroi]
MAAPDPSLAYTNPHAETNTDGRRDRVLPWPQISSFRIRTATDSIVPHGGSKLPDSDVTGSMSLCTNPSREEQLHLPPISPQSTPSCRPFKATMTTRKSREVEDESPRHTLKANSAS